ncbi:MAG: NTP transferase domain-containing protein [Deltaproteobacteria bacterium]|nr:NTP transferase domain-containing protein [Deltaproteobacteria bacterium]
MQALILAGGSGTRFWPLSRRQRPKQLLALEGDRSLLQQTFDRLQPQVPATSVWVCTTRLLADQVRQQLPEVPAEQVLEEPEGRNTAAAIGWAVRSMPRAARNGVVAVLPADHRVSDAEGFRQRLQQAEEAVESQDLVMTLGIEPQRPETGYGYLELGEVLDQQSGLRKVVRFREKPDLETARRFVDSGRFLWNGGIFLFRGSTFLSLLAAHLPKLVEGLEEIAAEPNRLAEIYSRLPATSIDFGLMEKLEDIATLPLDCGWSDLGSWQALAEVLTADSQGNICRGDVFSEQASDNLLVADSGTIAIVGLEGLVVVRTGDTVLVAPKERSQEVREIVSQLRAAGRNELL